MAGCGQVPLGQEEGLVISAWLEVACSKRSDSGERCELEVKKAMKSRGGAERLEQARLEDSDQMTMITISTLLEFQCRQKRWK